MLSFLILKGCHGNHHIDSLDFLQLPILCLFYFLDLKYPELHHDF
uniref:Uncharacterized protein n=1 Tax=Human betaherpesvirus 6 TaxID=10368 RepID=A0A5P9U469_9BETA|nr:hypothetical protein [Human betaherpesvirus 6]